MFSFFRSLLAEIFPPKPHALRRRSPLDRAREEPQPPPRDAARAFGRRGVEPGDQPPRSRRHRPS